METGLLFFILIFNNVRKLYVQMSGLSSAQNWLGSQGSSSGLIVKRTIRVDIPVEKFPSVRIIFSTITFSCCKIAVFDTELPLPTDDCSTTLLGASSVLGETLSRGWKQVLNVVF